MDVLNQSDWKTDFVITHCAPSSTQAILGFHDNNVLTKYLEEVRQKLTYKRWFFGHYHDNRQVNAQDILLYGQLVRVGVDNTFYFYNVMVAYLSNFVEMGKCVLMEFITLYLSLNVMK